MAKLSAAHQAAVDVKNAAQREALAYHHILTAIARESGKWGSLQRVGSVYDKGDSWVWQMAFTPRLRDAVIMETFDSAVNGDKTIRCFFLSDVQNAYCGHSFESTSVPGKFQVLYHHAVEMERIELNRAA
jgi:hypothetical protein